MTHTPLQSTFSHHEIDSSLGTIDPLLSYERFKHEWQQLENNCSKFHRHLMENIEFISGQTAIVRIKSKARKRAKKVQILELQKSFEQITTNALKLKKRGAWKLPDAPKKDLYDLISQIVRNKKLIEFFLQNIGDDQIVALNFNSVTSQHCPVKFGRKPNAGRVPTEIFKLLFDSIRKSEVAKRGIRR